MQNVALRGAGWWIRETSLCSSFAIPYKSVVISNVEVKKQKLLGHPLPEHFLGLGLCFLAFLGVEGLSIYGKDGCLAPGSQHLKQHDFSRQGEEWGPRGTRGKWEPWAPKGLLWEPLTSQLEKNLPLRQPGPAFSDTWLAQEVLPFPSTLHIFYKANSHFKLIPVSMQKTIRTQIFKGRPYSFRQTW